MMLESGTFSYFLQMLGYRIPMLLAYLVCLILALVFFRRSRSAAMLTILAIMMMVLASLGSLGVQTSLFHWRVTAEGDVQTYARLSYIFAMLGNIVNAFSLGLLAFAVFVGRSPAPLAKG